MYLIVFICYYNLEKRNQSGTALVYIISIKNILFLKAWKLWLWYFIIYILFIFDINKKQNITSILRFNFCKTLYTIRYQTSSISAFIFRIPHTVSICWTIASVSADLTKLFPVHIFFIVTNTHDYTSQPSRWARSCSDTAPLTARVRTPWGRGRGAAAASATRVSAVSRTAARTTPSSDE